MKTPLRALGVSGLIGATLVGFWAVIALVGPLLAPHEVGTIIAWEVFEPMRTAYPLGTDYLGRDVLSRMLSGARYSIALAFAAAALASTTGTLLGLFSAVSGRWVDEAMARLMDALISIPSKIFALVMVAAFGSTLPLLLGIIAFSYTPGAFRIARALAVDINQLDYVQVARTRGEGRAWIACVEVLPNMVHVMLADFGLRFVFALLLLSGMSFLGLGVQPPDADLGSLVRENISGLPDGAPAVIMPAIAIASLTIGMNLLIDSLRGGHRARAQEA